MRENEIEEMLARATDGMDHEWGWYRDDVPRLIEALRNAEMRADGFESDLYDAT